MAVVVISNSGRNAGLTDSVCSLRASDGGLLWKYGTGGRNVASGATISPDGSAVFVGSNDMRIHSLRASDGVLLWKQQVGKGGIYNINGNGIVTTPAVSPDGSTVFVTANHAVTMQTGINCIYSLRASDGELLFIHEAEQSMSSNPAVSPDGSAVFVSGGRRSSYTIATLYGFAVDPDRQDKQQETAEYEAFYVVAGLTLAGVSIPSVGCGVCCLGPTYGLVVGLVVTLRVMDTMTDWAFFAISMQSGRLERHFQKELLDAGGGYTPATHVYNSSLAFSIIGSLFLLPGLWLTVEKYRLVLAAADNSNEPDHEGSTTTNSGAEPDDPLDARENAVQATRANAFMVWQTILFEDVPQIAIGGVYMRALGSDTDPVSVACMVASGISLVISLCDVAYSTAIIGEHESRLEHARMGTHAI